MIVAAHLLLAAATAVTSESPLAGGVVAWDWSTDGRLAYATPEGLFVAAGPSLDQRRLLVRTPPGRAVGQVAWAPSARDLVFTALRPGDELWVPWLVEADGTALEDLARPGGSLSGRGSLSIVGRPDNDVLLLRAGCGTGCAQLLAFGMRDRGAEVVAEGGGSGFLVDSQWRLLAFQRQGGALVVGALAYTAGPCGTKSVGLGEAHEVFPGCACGPDAKTGYQSSLDDLVPDGSRVVATRWRCGTEPLEGAPPQLWSASRDGSSSARWADSAGWASLAPDGRRIAYIKLARGAPAGARASGGSMTAGLPWHPTLAVADTAGREIGETPIPLPGVSMAELADLLQAGLMRPVWSRNSRWVAVSNGKTVLIAGLGGKPVTLVQGHAAEATPREDSFVVARPRVARIAKPPEADFLPPTGREQWLLPLPTLLAAHFATYTSLGPSAFRDPCEHSAFLSRYARGLEVIGLLEEARAQFAVSVAAGCEESIAAYQQFLRRHGQAREADALTTAERKRLLEQETGLHPPHANQHALDPSLVQGLEPATPATKQIEVAVYDLLLVSLH